MIFRKKKFSPNDLTKGKQLFMRYSGNIFEMEHDGLYQEYKKFNIPKSIEEKWCNEILDQLEDRLVYETDITKKIVIIDTLINLGTREEEVIYYIAKALDQNIDTFSKILLCESLKRVVKYSSKVSYQQKIANIISTAKQRMLMDDFTVDEKYKKLPYMLDYDFSSDNLSQRINQL